jgi:hypothetical protein
MPVRRALCVVNDLIDSHTYDVENTLNPTTKQKIEVTHEEALYLIKNFNNDVPLLWNHGLDITGNKPIGKIIEAYSKDNGLFVIVEQDDDVISEVINLGGINNVSMNHSREGGIKNYKIKEVSVCHTGLRKGTGIIDLEPVLCSIEMSDMQDIVPEVILNTPSSNIQIQPIYDNDGFVKFQTNVHKWQTEGIKPEDYNETKDPTIYHYQMNRYAQNNFLDEQTSLFMINQLAKNIESDSERLERENKEKKTQILQVASLVDSIARNHLSSNNVHVTPEQLAEARKRLIQEAPLSAELPLEQMNRLCEVRASIDAEQAAQEVLKNNIILDNNHLQSNNNQSSSTNINMEIDNDYRNKQLDLQIKQVELEQLKIKAQLTKQEAKQEEIKHNNKMEAVNGITQRLQNRSRYNLPEHDEYEQPPSKQQKKQFSRSYIPSNWEGVDLSHSTWQHGQPTWGKPKKDIMKSRTLHEFALENNMTEAHNKYKEEQMRPGLDSVVCSKDYENYSRVKKIDDPLNHCLNLATMIFGTAAADPNARLTHSTSRIRRIQSIYAPDIVAQCNFSNNFINYR